MAISLWEKLYRERNQEYDEKLKENAILRIRIEKLEWQLFEAERKASWAQRRLSRPHNFKVLAGGKVG